MVPFLLAEFTPLTDKNISDGKIFYPPEKRSSSAIGKARGQWVCRFIPWFLPIAVRKHYDDFDRQMTSICPSLTALTRLSCLNMLSYKHLAISMSGPS